MRLVRFRFGDRIATGAIDAGSEDIRILRGTFFDDPIPTGEQVPLADVRSGAAAGRGGCGMSRDTRPKRDRHALTADGMVLCNPRDREAAHRPRWKGSPPTTRPP